MKYHINFEGKINPCQAKVLKCPYDNALHSDSKIELYYKLMESTHGTHMSRCKSAMKVLHQKKRLKDYSSFELWGTKDCCIVEGIVATLWEAIQYSQTSDSDPTDIAAEIYWENFEEAIADVVAQAYQYGVKFPSYVSDDIKFKSIRLYERRNPDERATNGHLEIIQYPNKGNVKTAEAALRAQFLKFEKYNDYKNGVIRNENYGDPYAWMKRDFLKFSHDLNTSKMITQPIFYGNIENAKNAIRNMDDYELLATFDDYSVTDSEIEENVKKANYFELVHEKRYSSLESGYYYYLSEWYKRNKEIYEQWKNYTPKRVLLAIEMANELDRRKLKRQDIRVGKMLAEGMWY